jgi:hypothetical protein
LQQGVQPWGFCTPPPVATTEFVAAIKNDARLHGLPQIPINPNFLPVYWRMVTCPARTNRIWSDFHTILSTDLVALLLLFDDCHNIANTELSK